ncbi:MAG: hypothetical protein PWP49_1297 [Thermococcaceae archaeon]|jgi:hypothetical protein|uniref:hypothetical protein n=1 Tax=Thermococcus TaxID=2263 RepID=UPI0005B2A1E1|nr:MULTISPECIES: hypothetical protein [Thermococcus]KUJ99948.1 MAG: Uncharacterized protein XD43_0392 [Thermococcales archaeon 44_46]MDK2782749.1 hypothetical protein [Thermococcaceae archaeon]MCA6213425.1 hypothetical protein [Thermococcus bergensis]MDK2853887.1 hypothetical protein [Thermococcaceae archaeon]MDK2983391.1 hypothetical protein [Thermococcaceae archaeon]
MIISKPCTTMKGMIVQPYSWDKEVTIDLKRTAECLKDKGYEVKSVIPKMMAIAVIDGYETSIYPSGKIIIKELTDIEASKEIAKKIIECAGLSELLED